MIKHHNLKNLSAPTSSDLFFLQKAISTSEKNCSLFGRMQKKKGENPWYYKIFQVFSRNKKVFYSHCRISFNIKKSKVF